MVFAAKKVFQISAKKKYHSLDITGIYDTEIVGVQFKNYNEEFKLEAIPVNTKPKHVKVKEGPPRTIPPTWAGVVQSSQKNKAPPNTKVIKKSKDNSSKQVKSESAVSEDYKTVYDDNQKKIKKPKKTKQKKLTPEEKLQREETIKKKQKELEEYQEVLRLEKIEREEKLKLYENDNVKKSEKVKSKKKSEKKKSSKSNENQLPQKQAEEAQFQLPEPVEIKSNEVKEESDEGNITFFQRNEDPDTISKTKTNEDLPKVVKFQLNNTESEATLETLPEQLNTMQVESPKKFVKWNTQTSVESDFEYSNNASNIFFGDDSDGSMDA